MTGRALDDPAARARAAAINRAAIDRRHPPTVSVWPGRHSNGTIGCVLPEHRVGEPAPPGLSHDEHVRWIVDHAPPLTAEQRGKIALLLGFR